MVALIIYGALGPEEKLRTTAKDIEITGNVSNYTDHGYVITLALLNEGQDAISFDSVNAEIGPKRPDLGTSLGFEIEHEQNTILPQRNWQKTIALDTNGIDVDASCICIEFIREGQVVVVASAQLPKTPEEAGPIRLKIR